jgi:hypothetical protein
MAALERFCAEIELRHSDRGVLRGWRSGEETTADRFRSSASAVARDLTTIEPLLADKFGHIYI